MGSKALLYLVSMASLMYIAEGTFNMGGRYERKVDGGWSRWSDYGQCSRTCGSGMQSRTRTCTNPIPSRNGAPCAGDAKQERECNTHPCPSGEYSMKPPYKKPKECHVKEPCCEQGQLKVHLGSTKLRRKVKKEGKLKGVEVKKIGRAYARPCSQTALISIDFEKIDNNTCFGCLRAPYCGRRMLKIDLELSNAGRGGWMFTVGDSISNNGYKGDANHQKNDAEIQALYPNITVYPSDNCDEPYLMYIIDGVRPSVDYVTIYVSNEHVRITNNEGLNYMACNECLYALNGQPDSGPNGGPNQEVFVSLNRVIDLTHFEDRIGYGVCSATLSWACPWCD